MYRLIQGEIGKDDLSDFVKGLPHVDVLYNAPPNPEMMSFWHKYEDVEYDYETFFSELVRIYKTVDADICYIESGTNYDMLINSLWYKHVETFEITYSAPMAKRRVPYHLVVASKTPISLDFKFKYSDDLLNAVLNTTKKMNVFDPCIGKGLLLKYAIKYGHCCYGIEYDQSRLDYALQHTQPWRVNALR